MKCNHCNAEWNAPNSQPTTCPFCGKSLIEELKTNDMQALEQILAQMYKNFPDVFKNKMKLSGMLADFMPHDKKMLRYFKNAAEYNVAMELLEAENYNENDKANKIVALKSNFGDEYGMKESLASYVIDCFAFALLGVAMQPMGTDDKKLEKQPAGKMPRKSYGLENGWIKKPDPWVGTKSVRAIRNYIIAGKNNYAETEVTLDTINYDPEGYFDFCIYRSDSTNEIIDELSDEIIGFHYVIFSSLPPNLPKNTPVTVIFEFDGDLHIRIKVNGNTFEGEWENPNGDDLNWE